MYLQAISALEQTRSVYDRSAAIAYAGKYWNVPCNDQFIALSGARPFVKVPGGTKFVHDFASSSGSSDQEHAVTPGGDRIEWANLDDCTHFISCCIGEPPGETGGGIPITYKQMGSPPTAPYGIVRVSTMVDYLLGRLPRRPTNYAALIGDEKTKDDRLIGHLQPGDLVAYWNIARGRYSHLTLYLGSRKIACHSYCRSNDPACTWDNNWDLGRGTHSWTFLHITA
jgi:hypothetical protein